MSGPYDVPDDPDEVTLWAGRLRAWPTRPSAPVDAEEIDEDTAVSARPAAGAVVVARRIVQVRAQRPGPLHAEVPAGG